MVISVIDYLEDAAKKYPNKIWLKNENKEISFSEAYLLCKKISNFILNKTQKINQPIIVGIDRDPLSIINILSVLMSNNYYIPIDITLPKERICKMIEISGTKICISNSNMSNKISNIEYINSSNISNDCIYNNSELLYRKIMPLDPFCGIFTSGSTGTPKCVIKSHLTVTSFVEIFCNIFNISSKNIFGNHVSFDFDVSIKDIFISLKKCCTLHIFPKTFSIFPIKLVQYIIENKIDIFICSTPILKFLTRYNIFDSGAIPINLKKVFFSGEEMTNKVLNYWKTYLPKTEFINLYAPTEVTGNCLYYISRRKIPNNMPLPLGKKFPHCDVFLVDCDGNKILNKGQIGEIYIRSLSLANGYLNDKQNTNKSFIQNKYINGYSDIVYKTGDFGKYDDENNIIFVGRQDSQIKYNGHRIELIEIELCALQHTDVEEVFCLFNKSNNEIVLLYQSKNECNSYILKNLKNNLPSWMIPKKIIHLNKMPLNNRLKIDRAKLISIYGR